MSRTRIALCLAACCLLAVALPLAAQVADGPGITVDIGNATLMHRAPVLYPAQARMRNVQGTVVVQVTLDAGGNVNDLHVVSGPDELRRAVMESLLQWHFANEGAGATRQISVTFKAPPIAQSISRATNSDGSIAAPTAPQGVMGGIVGGVPGGVRTPPAMIMPRIKSIDVIGLPDSAKSELMATLPIHAGDVPTPETMQKLSTAIKQFDEHLTLSMMGRSDGTEIRISPPGNIGSFSSSAVTMPAVLPPPAPGSGRINVSGNVQASKLIRHDAPIYPALAKQARISGVVKLQALIGKDGAVQNLTVISGHPLLVQASLDAVRNWAYEPTLLNGNPVEVLTQVDVNFTLADQPPQQ